MNSEDLVREYLAKGGKITRIPEDREARKGMEKSTGRTTGAARLREKSQSDTVVNSIRYADGNRS